MILICISSNILSFECGDSFCCHDMYLTLPVIIKLCYHIIMYLHINTTHIHYHSSTVSHSCAMIFFMSYAHVSYYITLSNMTCHTYTHVLHNINLVMSRMLFILNMSFYPASTILDSYFENTKYEKSIEFRMYFRKGTYDYSGILTRKAVTATVTSTCQSSHIWSSIQWEWNHLVSVDERTTPGNIDASP